MALIKEAAQNAIKFAQETLGVARAKDIQLEEVDSVTIGNEDYWIITLSMTRDGLLETANNLASLLGSSANRDYKTFHVRKDSGEVTSMKIREFALN